MNLIELIVVAVGLSMDAFAVSIAKGLSVEKVRHSHALSAGLWFGAFQGLMPIVGYYLAIGFSDLVRHLDHWIAFFLLGLIGGGMIRDAIGSRRHPGQCDQTIARGDFSFRTMLFLAVATSIDALAVGISFAVLQIHIFAAALIIALVTFVFSVAGIHIGNRFGCRLKSKAELAGGVILILVGLRILISHLFFQ